MPVTYPLYSDLAKKGQLFDSELHDVVSRTQAETIEVGRAVVYVPGQTSQNLVRLPKLNETVATFTGAITAGHIAVVVAGTTITQNFSSDEATTLSALAIQIAALPSVSSAAAASSVLTIKMKNIAGPATADFTVVASGLGDTLAVTVAQTSSDVFAGIAIGSDSLILDPISNTCAYVVGGITLNLGKKCRVAVYTETALAVDSTVFVRVQNDVSDVTKLAGNFRNDSASGLAIAWSAASVVIGTTAAGIAIIEINLP